MFLRQLPMTWDETRILKSDIGHYITTARRSGDRWFIASATDEQARTLELKLDFLESGESYSATLFEDGPEAHFQKNREAYKIRQLNVAHDSVIKAVMAPGGGHCVILKKQG